MRLNQLADMMADDLYYILEEDIADREDFVRALIELAHYYGNYEDEKVFYCLDCQVNTGAIGEYYMVHKELWLKANPDYAGMLCIGCLEARIGREVTRADFTDAPVNDIDESDFDKSERLKDRLSRV